MGGQPKAPPPHVRPWYNLLVLKPLYSAWA